MSEIRDQYEAFPYPPRDPADEAGQLITGSPSFPVEMDHCLWAGQRDWSRPLRALVAGGGTGDGLVQLAQTLTDAGKPFEIVYVDLSRASRRIAEARVETRRLQNIEFHSGSLLSAPDFGAFDYIDCCGVLHHLEDPLAGLDALKRALAPGGGMGFMVYAPYARAGIYPLQEAFARLFGDLPPARRLAAAKQVFEAVPENHPLRINPDLNDYAASDAGFYDSLLHSQDRPFDIKSWNDALVSTGWTLSAMAQPGLYDLTNFTPLPESIEEIDAMAVAEQLRGTIKAHVGYARRSEDGLPEWPDMEKRVPHLNGVETEELAGAVTGEGELTLAVGPDRVTLEIDADAVGLIRGIDGRRSVGEIASAAGAAHSEELWKGLDARLTPWGVVQYSRVFL